MQNRHESILRTINNSGPYNILTFPTHEAYQSNWSNLPHNFYLLSGGPNIKKWHRKYREVPENHTIIESPDGILPELIKIDIVISMNKFGQFDIAKSISDYIGVPLISLEHTACPTNFNEKQKANFTNRRGDINVFISEWSVNNWGYQLEDTSVKVINHAVRSDIFNDTNATHDDGKILTVMNDAINRTWCLGTDIYFRVTKDLPANPVGDTPGFSKSAIDESDLISKYKKCSVFFNSSTISPIPMSLLEAASCGCPIVTNATCAIPEFFKDGENCYISKDEIVLRQKLEWCLNNPEEARRLGQNARQTILDRFSLNKHLDRWNAIFTEAIENSG